MFLYDPPSIPPSQGRRLKADTFTVSLARAINASRYIDGLKPRPWVLPDLFRYTELDMSLCFCAW